MHFDCKKCNGTGMIPDPDRGSGWGPYWDTPCDCAHTRKSWDEYFLDIADMVAARSTCPRLSVGAVLVNGKRIVSTGYNGAPPGEAHCVTDGCLLVNNSCKRVIHGEINAIQYAVLHGLTYDKLCLSHVPCYKCQEYIRDRSAVKTVIYRRGYKDINTWILQAADIQVFHKEELF